MSNITGPRLAFLAEKDDYSKKCHRILRHYNCGHHKWAPKIVHVGCPHNPQSKKRCDNMASKPKDLYPGEMCSKCRPTVKEMSPDPFDALLKKFREDEQAQERIQRMEHFGSAGLILGNPKSQTENVGLQDIGLPNTKEFSQAALSQEEPCLISKEATNPASDRNANTSSMEKEEKENDGKDETIEPTIPKSDGGWSQPASRSLLASVWHLMKPTKKSPSDDTTQHHVSNPCDDWSDSDEEMNWEFMKNEDNQLWKDKEDDWVHIK